VYKYLCSKTRQLIVLNCKLQSKKAVLLQLVQMKKRDELIHKEKLEVAAAAGKMAPRHLV
jgi:hypothetical protein